jgi:hypothetical protein
LLGRASAVLLGLALGSCAPAYVTSSNAPVLFIIAAITGGGGEAVLDSDVRIGESSSGICPDYALVAVAVRNKNPNAPVPNVPAAVIIRSYEVRYFRSDGRAVEGADVPYRITGNLTATVDVQASGTSNIPIEVVRRQAKTEPPLSTIFQTSVLTMMAEVTLYGETVAGQAVSARGRLQIDFADFADELTACEDQPS